MNLARSTFYYKPRTICSEKMGREVDLMMRIEAICLEFPGYGYRRVTMQLKRERWLVNHKKVLRLMRANDLLCRVKRRRVRTTDSKHRFPRYPNLIKGIIISHLNQLWVADITYIRLLSGFVYLAAILDAFSRRAIGYAISTSLEMTFTLKALHMAIANRHPGIGVIHHSDQGVQYACNEYVDELNHHGFQVSMSRKSKPYDNAVMESFFKTLKYEEVYLCEYRTLADVEDRLPYFIEEVYNLKRLHSSLGYCPPNEFEESMVIKHNGMCHPARLS